MIETLFSIDAFVHETKSWNKKKKLLEGLINKHPFFKRENNTFTTTRFGLNTFDFCSDLMKILDEDFKKFCEETGFKEVAMLDAWAVKYSKNDFQVPHHHGRVMYTGILYLDVDKKQAPTTFIAPFSSETTGNTRLSQIECKEGTLVIFPGHLMHFVKPNPVKKHRIVISFDINCK